MAATLKGLAVTLDGTTQNAYTLLTSILGGNKFVYSVTLLPFTTNAGAVLTGSASMTGAADAFGSIPNTGSQYTVSEGFLDLSSLYIRGTNNDKVYISVVV